MVSPIQVIGYHGTTLQAAACILRDGFMISRNEYDWLGDGVYFFQDAPARSREWARTHHGSDAAVICSVIRVEVEDCMDLLDINWASVLNEAYDSFLRQAKLAKAALPVQTSGAHRLDRAVINYSVGILAEEGKLIRAVRSAFSEGAPVFPGSALSDRAHIQIAVRDTSIIVESELMDETGGPR